MDFCSDFHKIVVTRSSVCRTILVRRALESADPGASNGVSNFIFRHFGADLVTFEMSARFGKGENQKFEESRNLSNND